MTARAATPTGYPARLNVKRHRRADGARPLVVLHGFTGSADTWTPFVASIGPHRELIAVDLPGHGQSGAPADVAPYSMAATVASLVDTIDGLGLDRFDLLGYSMGGRVALHLALAAPERLGSLVLESATAGMHSAAERAERRASDAALALTIERDGVEAFVDRWERLPLFASQSRLDLDAREELRRQRRRNSAIGLANSLRGLGAGAVEPVWERLGEIAVPTLLIAGALDGKYRALAEEIAAGLRDARVAIISDTGHAVHLERPSAFADVVVEFLGHQ